MQILERGVFINGEFVSRAVYKGNYVYCPCCSYPLYKGRDTYDAFCVLCRSDLYYKETRPEGTESRLYPYMKEEELNSVIYDCIQNKTCILKAYNPTECILTTCKEDIKDSIWVDLDVQIEIINRASEEY